MKDKLIQAVEAKSLKAEKPYFEIGDTVEVHCKIQEGDKTRKVQAFEGFQVSKELTDHASPSHIVMHCLPAHRGEEITDEVIDGPHPAVYNEAENRLHAQKAIMALLM